MANSSTIPLQNESSATVISFHCEDGALPGQRPIAGECKPNHCKACTSRFSQAIVFGVAVLLGYFICGPLLASHAMTGSETQHGSGLGSRVGKFTFMAAPPVATSHGQGGRFHTGAHSLGHLSAGASTRASTPQLSAASASKGKLSGRVLYIDGNNLMFTRKVTKGRKPLAEKLAGIIGSQTILVFDGRKGEAPSVEGNDPQVVVTSGGDENGVGKQSADDWIEDAIAASSYARVEVVTADRKLRAALNGGRAKCINPRKFWRRYLPRLKGMKNSYENKPKKAVVL